MSDARRLARPMGILHLEDIDWFFRVYLLRGNLSEVIEKEVLFRNLGEKVRVINANYLSLEFQYIRSGFSLAHYGRRGVTYSFWHWADWVGTWEYFCQAWYCYGRALETMGPLDRSEPILCQHEIEIVSSEGRLFHDLLARCNSQTELVQLYRSRGQ